ncbi:hypothetical protein CN907_27015 [Bacillus anthracis]|nr:hypothetical protein CN907_27015 [Bacillus anthracis]
MENNQIWIEITSSNWGRYRYFKSSKNRGYVWLDKKPLSVSLKDVGDNDLVVLTGGTSKMCKDRIGRPADCFSAHGSYTADSLFYVFPGEGPISGGKNWLTVYPELHRMPWDFSYVERHPFVFIPADSNKISKISLENLLPKCACYVSSHT